MWIKLLGSLGFLCYFAYDINSITKNNRLLQKGFLVGTVLVALATAGIFAEGLKISDKAPVRMIFFGILTLFFFALLIYTLFFALPFEATYVEDSHKRYAYTEDVYALCRHPGVLWYACMYLCIAAALFTKQSLIDGALLIAWNLLYIVLQDRIIFPATFTNYGEYKKTTPFLLPNKRSISRYWATRRRGGGFR